MGMLTYRPETFLSELVLVRLLGKQVARKCAEVASEEPARFWAVRGFWASKGEPVVFLITAN